MEYRKYLREEKNARREEVIINAARLFLERGLENVKMTDIAEECGLGVASLYRYFGTKTALAIAVGERLWKDIVPLFDQIAADFDRMSGLERLKSLFGVFPRLYEEQRGFLKFIHDFDALMIRENTEPDSLKDYESAALSFYPIFEDAYKQGLADGSIHEIPDFETYYFTSTHLLLFTCQKFAVGAILRIDTEKRRQAELERALDMILSYIS